MNTVRILGLDLSTTNVGYCLIEHPGGSPLYSGEFEIGGKDWLDRLSQLEDTLWTICQNCGLMCDRVLQTYRPPYVMWQQGKEWVAGIEWPVLGYYKDKHGRVRGNPDSLIKQSIFIGEARSILGSMGISVPHFPNPIKVKEALTGYYGSSKEDMILAAKIVLGETPGEHEADALGVALAVSGWLVQEGWKNQ